MDYVVGISWPRSGHHMLLRLLKLYFGPSFGYCSLYGDRPEHPEVPQCCRCVPCTNAGKINFSKNHDFDLSPVIQYRSE